VDSGRAWNRSVVGHESVVKLQREDRVGSPKIFQSVVDDQRLTGEYRERNAPRDPNSAQHRRAHKQRSDDRSGGHACDQQNQVGLLVKSRGQQGNPNTQVAESNAADPPFSLAEEAPGGITARASRISVASRHSVASP